MGVVLFRCRSCGWQIADTAPACAQLPEQAWEHDQPHTQRFRAHTWWHRRSSRCGSRPSPPSASDTALSVASRLVSADVRKALQDWVPAAVKGHMSNGRELQRTAGWPVPGMARVCGYAARLRAQPPRCRGPDDNSGLITAFMPVAVATMYTLTAGAPQSWWRRCCPTPPQWRPAAGRLQGRVGSVQAGTRAVRAGVQPRALAVSHRSPQPHSTQPGRHTGPAGAPSTGPHCI